MNISSVEVGGKFTEECPEIAATQSTFRDSSRGVVMLQCNDTWPRNFTIVLVRVHMFFSQGIGCRQAFCLCTGSSHSTLETPFLRHDN